jgi:hypothetical protein
VANLSPISTTVAKLVEKFAAVVADTGGAPLLSNIREFSLFLLGTFG